MKNVLITGASGFLGTEIYNHLKSLRFRVVSLGRSVDNDIVCDLAKEVPNLKKLQFNYVIHAAGKAHIVPKTEKERKEFFEVNLEGTKNLIKGLEQVEKLPKSIIYISTVAVYGLESGENINEEQSLNGSSPYALSKIQAEIFLKIWCLKNKVTLGILRPSLIAGPNPLGNLRAMINGIKAGKYLRIGYGSARKSILMAEDIARIIPKLAKVGGVYNVCDNHHPSFYELEELISKQLDKKPPTTIPYWFAKSLALVGDIVGNKFPINSKNLNKITKSLTFSNEKAKCKLDWEPLDVLQNFKIS